MQEESPCPNKKSHWRRFGLLLRNVCYEERPTIKHIVKFFNDGGHEMKTAGWAFLFICCAITVVITLFGEYEIQRHLFNGKTTLLSLITNDSQGWSTGSAHNDAFIQNTVATLKPLGLAERNKKYTDMLKDNEGLPDNLALIGIATLELNDYQESANFFQHCEKMYPPDYVSEDDTWRVFYPYFVLAVSHVYGSEACQKKLDTMVSIIDVSVSRHLGYLRNRTAVNFLRANLARARTHLPASDQKYITETIFPELDKYDPYLKP
jgi:hypothetical protein